MLLVDYPLKYPIERTYSSFIFLLINLCLQLAHLQLTLHYISTKLLEKSKLKWDKINEFVTNDSTFSQAVQAEIGKMFNL